MKPSPWGAQLRKELEAQGWKVQKRIVPTFICTKGEQVVVLEGRVLRDGLTLEQRKALLGITGKELKVTVARPDRRVVLDAKWEARIKELSKHGVGPKPLHTQITSEGFKGSLRTVEAHLYKLKLRGEVP